MYILYTHMAVNKRTYKGDAKKSNVGISWQVTKNIKKIKKTVIFIWIVYNIWNQKNPSKYIYIPTYINIRTNPKLKKKWMFGFLVITQNNLTFKEVVKTEI